MFSNGGTKSSFGEDYLSSFRVKTKGDKAVKVPHLLFANDPLVFCEDSQNQTIHLSWLPMQFEETS